MKYPPTPSAPRVLNAPILGLLIPLLLASFTPRAASATADSTSVRAPALTQWCVAPAGQRIDPCSGTTTAPAGATGRFNFTVTNPTSTDVGYTTAVSCTGLSTTTCRAGTSLVYVAGGGGTVTVPVEWAVPASPAGTLTVTVVLRPTSKGIDTLRATVKVSIYIPPTYTVSVTPDGSEISLAQPLNTSYQFRVENLGNTSATYALSATCSSGATGCSAPATVPVSSRSYQMVSVSFNSGSAGTQGKVTLKASADSTGGPGTTGGIVTSDEGFITVRPLTHTVVVTPADSVMTVPAGVSRTAAFTVALTGTASSVTYTLQIVSCTEPLYDCSAPGTVTATPSSPGTVTVSYKTRGNEEGGTGRLSLRAYSTYGPTTYESTGSYRLTVPNTVSPLVITAASPTTAIERGACLTVAASEAAAYECGDLRLVHAIPSVRTMGKERAPVLLYASQTAQPLPSIRADILLQRSAGPPTSLTGTLTIGTQSCSQNWTTTGWMPGTVRRVVALCASTALPTNAYPFTLQVTAVYPDSVRSKSVSGTLIVINRSASPFGAGWWMAGLEQLYFPTDASTRLWVAGDGSARVYRRVGTSNTFYADSLDQPDSLTFDPGTATYTRWAAQRLQVRFDNAGRHVATINRLGHTTTFTYSGGLLQSIAVPPAAAGLSYTFGYVSGQLASITAPGATASRVTKIAQSATRVDSITDADTTTVRFGYTGASPRITTRTDRLGHATSFTYDGPTGTLSGVSLAMAAPTPAIATSFRAAEAVGISGAAAADTSVVYTLINGPRRDTTVTSVWVDRFGAPRRVRDAMGGETRIERGDTRWPLLATTLVSPGGFTSRATYDGRGNPSTQTAVDPLGGALGAPTDAVTSYQYDATYDYVTRVTGPTGEIWRAIVDPATGNRLQESLTDTGSVHSTTYRYDATCGMVRAVLAPGTPADSVAYDARCNPVGFRSPLGYWSRLRTDPVGRVVADSSPDGKRDSTVYDVMGRIVKQFTIGPTRNGVGSQTLTVSMGYDRSGRLTSVSRSGAPDPAWVGTVTTLYRYDWAGRRVAEVAPDGAVDSTAYDASGNAIAMVTRLGGSALPIVLTYDPLNRLRKRNVPAYVYSAEAIGVGGMVGSLPWMHPYPMYPNVAGQTGYTVAAQVDTFAYDSAGRMTLANNGDAKVSRTFYPNGLIASETQRLRTLKDTAAGGDFTRHVYTVGYAYDLAGRRTTLTVPSQLAPRIQPDTLAAALLITGQRQETRDQITYTYDTGANGTGWLMRVDGLLPGESFRYGYTPRGEISTLSGLEPVPDAPPVRPVREVRTYNDDGELVRHQATVGLGGVSAALRDAGFTVDAVGRVLALNDTTSYGVWIRPTTVSYTYSGLGHLLSSNYETTDPAGSPQWAQEGASYDALGNWASRSQAATTSFNSPMGSGTYTSWSGTRQGRYTASTGRLRAESLDGGRADTLIYDAAGNLHAMLTTSSGSPAQYTERVSYYRLDGRLVAADARSAVGGTLVGHTAFEEYRYDALGRRVWARVRRWCNDESGAGSDGDRAACDISALRRTVWDGSRELAEIQMPAADMTPTDTLENDTLPVQRRRDNVMPQPYYDANRLYGRVLYVHGLATDQPLAITRVHYADASNDSLNSGGYTGAQPYAVYAPFSIVPLWNSQGRADRAVMGGTAAPGQDLLCVDATRSRCALVAIDQGVLPYGRQGSDPGVWQGTLLVDKSDATGTYYRRNRSYDPATARFTQEDPIGLAGGINLYGFANGDPVSYSDPFGLTPCWMIDRRLCRPYGYSLTAALLGSIAGNPLTGADVRFLLHHPVIGYNAFRMVGRADAATRRLVETGRVAGGLAGMYNGPGDAVRHALASCEMSRAYGDAIAQSIGDGHEGNERNPAGERAMDSHNNAAGRSAAAQNGSCMGNVLRAYDAGELMIAVPTGGNSLVPIP